MIRRVFFEELQCLLQELQHHMQFSSRIVGGREISRSIILRMFVIVDLKGVMQYLKIITCDEINRTPSIRYATGQP